jgi:chromosome partitioning protein
MSIRIFDAEIPVAIKAAEAGKCGESIFAYDQNSKPAKAYEALTKEVIKDAEKRRDKAAVVR